MAIIPISSGPTDKPLEDKLGFTPGDTVFVDTTPDWYSDFAVQAAIETVPDLPATHVHLFVVSQDEIMEFLEDYKIKDIEKSLWFSWPKKASGIKSDVTEQTFRDIILPLGWVDTKVVAVDDTWSGLKFLRRKPTPDL